MIETYDEDKIILCCDTIPVIIEIVRDKEFNISGSVVKSLKELAINATKKALEHRDKEKPAVNVNVSFIAKKGVYFLRDCHMFFIVGCKDENIRNKIASEISSFTIHTEDIKVWKANIAFAYLLEQNQLTS